MGRDLVGGDLGAQRELAFILSVTPLPAYFQDVIRGIEGAAHDCRDGIN